MVKGIIDCIDIIAIIMYYLYGVFGRHHVIYSSGASPIGSPMASITIRNLTDEQKQALRERAAQNGRSMEAEARAILNAALGDQSHRPRRNLYKEIRELFEPIGGVDLPEIKRDPMRDPPKFE